jgi:hypothetical protein
VGGVAGAAVSRAVGALNLTVSYQRADLTEVNLTASHLTEYNIELTVSYY